ncbi:hypothetical protein FXO38_00760 [Capsicum annuum]|nr:hypothetical protein FXO38_00760 [Capsicum annuum]
MLRTSTGFRVVGYRYTGIPVPLRYRTETSPEPELPGLVGMAKSGENSNFKTRGKQLKEKGSLWDVASSIKKVEHVGQNLSPIDSYQQRTIEKAQMQDITDIEIQANICSSQKNILSYRNSETTEGKADPVIQLDQIEESVMANQLTHKEVVESTHMQITAKGDTSDQVKEDVIPLNVRLPADNSSPVEETTQEFSAEEWIQQYIIQLSSELGVDFKGCEEKGKGAIHEGG